MIIRKVLKKSSLVMTALTLGMSAISMNVSASASDTLDNLTANATFNYTGGDGKKLSQIGRHAYTFGRIRFSNPTTAVNLVNLTAPSISPPNCNSININLGSFDIISLDEAVSILRRIASEALTYGFGLALQSMCSPCWTAMKTLQTQLERLNLANRNTCTMVKSFIDENTDNGQLFNVFGDMCKGS
jgi:conjugative transfer pilus assembly protein TraH